MAQARRSISEEVVELLQDPRFEIMPFKSFPEQIAHLPDGSTVTITASPSKDIEATISRAEEAAEKGYDPVPHVAARYVRDQDHLSEIAQRLQDVGITDIFVPGGDREKPVGEFDSAYALLSTLDDLGYEFEEVGITGYPEGHPILDKETLVDSMQRKAPFATYITTQLCYDPDTIVEWIEEVRRREIQLPVQIGIPGVMKYQKLLNISQRVGVGDSLRFLHKTTGILDFLRQLIGSRGTYAPDNLVEGLAEYSGDPHYNIQNLHIYTFNQIPDTEAWRREMLKKHRSA